MAAELVDEGEAADDPRLPELSLLAISVGAGGEAGFEARLEEVGAAVAAAGPAALAAAARWRRHPDRLCGTAKRLPPRRGSLHARAARAHAAAHRRSSRPHALHPRSLFERCCGRPRKGAAIVARLPARSRLTPCASRTISRPCWQRTAAAPPGSTGSGSCRRYDGGSAIGLYALDREQRLRRLVPPAGAAPPRRAGRRRGG